MTCLTDEERRVIELAAEGLGLKGTAYRMHRSVGMVKIYRARAYEKLGTVSAAQAVRRLAEHDLETRMSARCRRRGKNPQAETLGL